MASHAQHLRRMTLVMGSLLIILMATIAYVLWQDKASTNILQNPDRSPVTLRIQRPGFADMLMQRQAEDQWLLEEPCTLPVNQQRLQPLLAALQPASHFYSAKEVDLEAAGLLDPLSTIVLNETTILIGATDLQGQRRYIQRGDRVEFAPEWIQALISGGISAFAELDLFDFEFDHVSAVVAEGNPVKLSSTEPEPWQALTAQQVLTWPIETDTPAHKIFTLSFDNQSEQRQAEAHQFETFTAVKFQSQQCAYILPNDTLPFVSTD